MAGHLVTVVLVHGTAVGREGIPAQTLPMPHLHLSVFDKSLHEPRVCARIVRIEGHGAFPEKWHPSISINTLGFSQLPPA